MCGRFSLAYTHTSLINWYHAHLMPDIAPRYNIAPATPILTVRDGENGRAGTMMRWGLIPKWANDNKKLPLLFNARAETILSKPLFKASIRHRRCIIPASGFFEWKQLADGKTKQLFYISAKNDNPLSLGGIWETNKSTDGAITESCSIITTDSTPFLQDIHNRMPLILPAEAWDTWLSPSTLPDDALLPYLKPSTEPLQYWAVSSAVGSIANQGEELIQAVRVDAGA